jgi:hypothetical protein
MFWGFEGGVPSAAEVPNLSAITVKDSMFSPTPLTVKAGTTVTWSNLDDEPHTVVSDTGVFKSGGMDTNESFSFKFDKPGTYHFAFRVLHSPSHGGHRSRRIADDSRHGTLMHLLCRQRWTRG